MGRGRSKEGEAQRLRILAELAQRYIDFQLQPTWDGLSEATGIPVGTLRYHVMKLQALGFMHPHGLWITRAGLARIGLTEGLQS